LKNNSTGLEGVHETNRVLTALRAGYWVISVGC